MRRLGYRPPGVDLLLFSESELSCMAWFGKELRVELPEGRQ